MGTDKIKKKKKDHQGSARKKKKSQSSSSPLLLKLKVDMKNTKSMKKKKRKSVIVKHKNEIFTIHTYRRVPLVVKGKVPVGTWVQKQHFTPEGYPYDQVKSSLQKDIRRCTPLTGIPGVDAVPGLPCAVYWAIVMARMGGVFQSNLKNRLKVIVLEDVSVASPAALIYTDAILEEYEKCENGEAKMRKLIQICKGLSLSMKCRLTDEAIHAHMEPMPKNLPDDFEDLDYSSNGDILYEAEQGETNTDYKTYMTNLANSLSEGSVAKSLFWIQKIYDINKRSCVPRQAVIRKSRDFIWGVWNLLEAYILRQGIFSYIKIPPWRIDIEVYKILRKWYMKMKDGRTERLHLAHMILQILERPATISAINWELESSKFAVTDEQWHLIKKLAVYHKPTNVEEMSNSLFNQMRKSGVLPIPKYALDCHTKEGRKLGRGLAHFWSHGAKLKNTRDDLMDDSHLKRAKILSLQREREGMKPRKRMKPKK